MSYHDPIHDVPPPPAYSEEEFDRKVSSTVQISLATPQPQPSSDDWEIWDDSVFEANAQALSASNQQGSSSSQAGPSVHSVEPLNITKKGFDPGSKPRPSWLAQAENTREEVRVSQHEPESHVAASSYTFPSQPEVNEHTNQPPPAFSECGPSLDGPPYEQIVGAPWEGAETYASPQIPDESILAPPQVMVPPWEQDGSTMGSPPASPILQNPVPQAGIHHRIPRPHVDTQRLPRHSLPATTHRGQQQHLMPQRPVSHIPLPTPISTFDSSMAYNQDSQFSQQRQMRDFNPQDHVQHAASFYNSAVANQMKSRPLPNRSPQPNFPHHSHYHRPMSSAQPPYGQGGHPPGMAPAHNPAAPRFNHYAQYPNSTLPPPHFIG